MSKRLLLGVLMAHLFIVAFAQDENKLSWSTQLFLQEMKGEISLDKQTMSPNLPGLVPVIENKKTQ